MEGKTLFFREWLDKGILSIQDLLDDTGHILSYPKFKTRYVISAIPKNLLNKAKTSDPVKKESYSAENGIIQLDKSTQLDLNKAKTCDFYKQLNVKTHKVEQTGLRRWNVSLSMDEDSRKKHSPPSKIYVKKLN